MTEPKFTPGPWEARRFKRTGWEVGKVSTAHDQSFGIFIDHAEVLDEADAHLIAAAPELYDAASNMLDAFKIICDRVNWAASAMDADAIEAMNTAPNVLERALAKARGEL